MDTPYADGVEIQSIISAQDGSSNLSTQRLILSVGGKIDLHSVPKDLQILVFVGKGAIYDKADTKNVAIDSDVFFIQANTPFKIENEGKTPLVLFITSAIPQSP
jgi:mannose-6-phosphate isomerase-like protein (cupin superfamily)